MLQPKHVVHERSNSEQCCVATARMRVLINGKSAMHSHCNYIVTYQRSSDISFKQQFMQSAVVGLELRLGEHFTVESPKDSES